MARVLLFGPLRDLAGWRERTVAGETLAGLQATLTSEDPILGGALAGPGVRVAVDQVMVDGDVVLGPDVEVAFLPPMSGG